MGEHESKPPARRLWKMGKRRKALKPQGKVPRGVRGLTKSLGGELASERAQKWDAEESRNVANWVSRSPAWAISAALHIVAGVILMNVVYFTQHQRLGQVFRMTLRAAAPGGAQGEQSTMKYHCLWLSFDSLYEKQVPLKGSFSKTLNF